MSKDNKILAFTGVNESSGDVINGMTLRDEFAAKAMQGLCVNFATFSNSELNIKSISEWSYQFADAMLRARES
jgi:hypothetical protein